MPGRVEAASRRTVQSAPALGRTAAMKALFKSVERAVDLAKPHTTPLELKTPELHTGKNGVKAVVVAFDREADGKKIGLKDGLPADAVYIDEGKKQFYVPHWRGAIGPLPLPAGVTVRALIDPGPQPAPKNAYGRALAALRHEVLDGLPQVMRDTHHQFEFKKGAHYSPSGERMMHRYIDDPTHAIPGQGLMIGKKEFWVEMIPGYSGDCIGPFKLPKGFKVADLDEKPARGGGRRSGGVDDDFDRGGGRSVGGGDSSRGYPDSIGRLGNYGSGSGGWGGGGGSWGGGGGNS